METILWYVFIQAFTLKHFKWKFVSFFFRQKIGIRGDKSQCTMHSFDRHTEVVMFSQVAWNGVSCWNSRNPLNKDQIAVIDSDDVKMIYPVDLNVSVQFLGVITQGEFKTKLNSLTRPEEDLILR